MSSSNENHSNPTPNPKPNQKPKRWFKRPSPFQNKASSSSKNNPPANAAPSSSTNSTITSTQASTSASAATSSTMPSSNYAPSTYTTTSTTTTLKPLIPGSSPRKSRSSKAWSKTKDLLSSLGEPPTAQYDREQMMKRGVGEDAKTDGREAYGAPNYGPYGAGGTFGGRL